MKRRKHTSQSKIVALLVALSLVPGFYFLYQQKVEDRIVRKYLSDNHLLGLPLTKETAVKVSHTVRRDFNDNEKTWKSLSMRNRPFFRHDTRFLLECREGLCGEGARVVICLLNELGFNATRLRLFTDNLISAHTLATVSLNGREFFVDSINSSSTFNDFIVKHDVSPGFIPVLHYNDDIMERRRFREEAAASQDSVQVAFREGFPDYKLYSYETLPMSKILSNLRIDMRVLNLARPPRWISNLAEKPDLIMATLFFGIAGVFDVALWLLWRRFSSGRSRSRVLRPMGSRMDLADHEALPDAMDEAPMRDKAR